MASFQLKDVRDWTNGEHGDVLAFLRSVLPGHPCLGYFKYTTGHVLASLSKDDLRRQCRDDEAANIVWVELDRHRQVVAEKRAIDEAHPQTITLFVRTPADVAIELECYPSDTIWALKLRLADVEGTPAEQQRLISNGLNMEDRRTLASLRLMHGAVLLLVPRLTAAIRSIPPTTPRGMLMVPGNRAWQPSHSLRPWMPLVATDTYRPFPMNIEFDDVNQYAAFMQTVLADQNVTGVPAPEQAVLEIVPSDASHKPVQSSVHFDATNEVVRVDTVGDIVVPNARYKAVMRVPEKEASPARALGLTITTGNKIA